MELQDQVKDLMFYLETQKKVAEASEETRQVSHHQRLVRNVLLCNLLVLCHLCACVCVCVCVCLRQELQEGQLVVSPKVAAAGNSSATGSGGKRRGRRKH